MESSCFNEIIHSQGNENYKSMCFSFTSTRQSCTSPGLLNDISNKEFNLNDLISNSPLEKATHRKINSDVQKFLHPKHLFHLNWLKSGERRSFEVAQTKRNRYEKFDSFQESEEIMIDINKAGGGKRAIPNIFINVGANMRFCKTCNKIVEIKEGYSQSDEFDKKNFNLFCVLVTCLKPSSCSLRQFETCTQCGNTIYNKVINQS